MPVEIRELQITTIVSDTSAANKSAKPPVDTNNIIAQCVEQVLDILKQKTER